MAPDRGREKKIGEGETMGAWSHVRAILLLPGMVLVVIPAVILWLTGPDTLGIWRSVPTSKAILPALGGVCVGLGLVLIVATARLFGTVGRGRWLRGTRRSGSSCGASTATSATR